MQPETSFELLLCGLENPQPHLTSRLDLRVEPLGHRRDRIGIRLILSNRSGAGQRGSYRALKKSASIHE